jgi:hypothetical protein
MFKIKDSRDIRFYLYVSDAKVDMLFEQMFRAQKRATKGQLTVKAGIFAGSTESTTEDSGPDRDDKVRAIEKELFEQNLVGTPREPRDYFRGILPMRWGMYNDLELRPEGCPPLVYFGGVDPTVPLIVGLGGSSTHVLGHAGATSTYSRSATPTLVRWLVSGLYNEDDVEQRHRRVKAGLDGDLYESIGVALHYLRPPTQQLEFLAKTLAVGKSYGLEHMTGFAETTVVLGTPICVYQAHPLPDPKLVGLDDEWKEHLNKMK